MINLKEVKISKLKKSKFFKRKHSSDQLDKCISGIEKFGQYQPIVVSGDEIICGNMVYDALKKMKRKTCFVNDLGEISEERKKEIRYIDNHVFDIEDWDEEKLKDYLMQVGNEDLLSSGFTLDESELIINGLENEDSVSVMKDLVKEEKEIWFCPECGWNGELE